MGWRLVRQAVSSDNASTAPVAGRVCQTGVRLLPQVTETLIAYDEVNRILTYEAGGMPAFVTIARNTWTVTPLDQRRTRVSLQAQFDTHGLLGRLARWAILAQVRRTSRYLAEDLRHFAEHATPSRVGRPSYAAVAVMVQTQRARDRRTR